MVRVLLWHVFRYALVTYDTRIIITGHTIGIRICRVLRLYLMCRRRIIRIHLRRRRISIRRLRPFRRNIIRRRRVCHVCASSSGYCRIRRLRLLRRTRIYVRIVRVYVSSYASYSYP